MCPPSEDTNGHANGNGVNGTNGNHDGYTGVKTSQNPHPTHKSPYQPVGDFLSNVSRFKIIGTFQCLSQALSEARTIQNIALRHERKNYCGHRS